MTDICLKPVIEYKMASVKIKVATVQKQSMYIHVRAQHSWKRIVYCEE